MGTPPEKKSEPYPGTLYIVSTPIGNLEDLSFRAAKILAGVDLIAAEDTRTTAVLLDHYQIRKPLVSYFSHNEARRTPELIERLRAGLSIAVVSDAGTPGISDPAYRIIRAALDGGIPVIAIPGASALLPALVSSGLPTMRFAYEGFIPVKKGRKTFFERLKKEERTIVLYESPHRLLKTLQQLRDALGDRRISVSRELTKRFEETVRGSIDELITHFSTHPIKGEFVLVIEGADKED
jgi:16S rRNA (cytidine1402-2'-O)-methyltransferase